MKDKNAVVIAISGLKNSGKTTLIEKLIPCLKQKGYITAVIKHDGHSFAPDSPGTDSYRFFQAGALGAAVFDREKVSVTKRCDVNIDALLELFQEADFILLEGFKATHYPKIVLQGLEKEFVSNSTWLALVGKEPKDIGIPFFHWDDIDSVANFLICCRKEGINHD